MDSFEIVLILIILCYLLADFLNNGKFHIHRLVSCCVLLILIDLIFTNFINNKESFVNIAPRTDVMFTTTQNGSQFYLALYPPSMCKPSVLPNVKDCQGNLPVLVPKAVLDAEYSAFVTKSAASGVPNPKYYHMFQLLKLPIGNTFIIKGYSSTGLMSPDVDLTGLFFNSIIRQPKYVYSPTATTSEALNYVCTSPSKSLANFDLVEVTFEDSSTPVGTTTVVPAVNMQVASASSTSNKIASSSSATATTSSGATTTVQVHTNHPNGGAGVTVTVNPNQQASTTQPNSPTTPTNASVKESFMNTGYKFTSLFRGLKESFDSNTSSTTTAQSATQTTQPVMISGAQPASPATQQMPTGQTQMPSTQQQNQQPAPVVQQTQNQQPPLGVSVSNAGAPVVVTSELPSPTRVGFGIPLRVGGVPMFLPNGRPQTTTYYLGTCTDAVCHDPAVDSVVSQRVCLVSSAQTSNILNFSISAF